MVDRTRVLAPVLDRLLERTAAAIGQVGRHALELGPAELLLQVQRAVWACTDERQVDRGLGHLRQLDLRLLGGFLQPLHRHAVLREVDRVVALEPLDQPIDDPLVPIVAPELSVAVGGLHFHDALADLEQRNVEGAASQVEHEDRLLGPLLVQPVRERRGRRLVDDAEHLEAGDLPGFLGGLSLGVVEVGRHRDHGLRHAVPQEGLRVTLQLVEDLRGDLLGRPALPVDVDRPVLVAHVALDRPDRPVRVGDGLPLGDLTDQDLARLGEGHDRRCRSRALRVRDDDRFPRLKGGDDRVRRTEVHTYRSCHRDPLSLSSPNCRAPKTPLPVEWISTQFLAASSGNFPVSDELRLRALSAVLTTFLCTC